MPEPFKNMFSREFVKKLAAATVAVEPAFRAADMLARTIVAPAELPIGIITALAGAPFFLWVLLRDRTRNGW